MAKTRALIAAVWFALSGAVFFTLVGDIAPSLESTVWGDVTHQLSNSQIIAYLGVGFVLAGIVVTLSVVTIPMIIERHVDVGTAMRMSARVTARDLAGHQGIHITTPQTPGRLALMGM